jgi:2-oxoisovalerate dehydrogenase E1 component beta subunit
VAALVAEQAFDHLDAPISRLCGPDVPTMPFAQSLETAYMPDTEGITQAMRTLVAY